MPGPSLCARTRILQQEPPTFLAHPPPTRCPLSYSCGSPARPVHKRTRLMRTEAGAGGGACACERLRHLCMVEPWPCRRVALRGATSRRRENLRASRGRVNTGPFIPALRPPAAPRAAGERARPSPTGPSRGASRPLCKKCRQTPISTLLVSPPLFPRSPHSALGGRAGGARLGEARFRRLQRRARERIGAFGPSAKSVGRPLFLLY